MSEVVGMMEIALFLACLLFAGVIFERFGSPALIGEIMVGCILGPELLDVIPHVGAVMLLGQVGLVFLVLEGGLHIDLETLQKIGNYCISLEPFPINLLFFFRKPIFTNFLSSGLN